VTRALDALLEAPRLEPIYLAADRAPSSFATIVSALRNGYRRRPNLLPFPWAVVSAFRPNAAIFAAQSADVGALEGLRWQAEPDSVRGLTETAKQIRQASSEVR
jgi:hypothetical protein